MDEARRQITLEMKSFADKFRLKLKRDECGELYVPCRRGQIHDHGNGKFAVLMIGPAATPRAWSATCPTLLRAGFVLHQDGDAEGSLLFDHANVEQCRLAIWIMAARRARRYSPKDRERLTRQPATVRRNQATPCENVAFAA